MSGSAYGPHVLEHFRRPRNRGALGSATHSHEATNPLCGDRVRLQLTVVEGVIDAARFTADGCALCIASASVVTELVRGQTLADAREIDEARVLDELEATVPASRMQCIRLPVTALHAAIEGAPATSDGERR